MVHRQIDAALWEDAKFATLEEAGFFAFLITGRRSRVSGLIEATPDQLAGDLAGKLDADEVLTYLKAFQTKKVLIYDQPWLWIVNQWQRHGAKTPSFFQQVAEDLVECESFVIWRRWQAKYAMWMPSLLKVARRREFPFIGIIPSDAELDLDASLPAVKADRPEAVGMKALLYEKVVQAVWGHYQALISDGKMLSPKRRAKIITRLGDKIKDPVSGQIRGVTVDDLKAAITACSRSAWHMGRDPKTNGKTYNELEDHILLNCEQLERWLTWVPPGERKKDARRAEPEGFARVSLAEPEPPGPKAPAQVSLIPPAADVVAEPEEAVLRPEWGRG